MKFPNLVSYPQKQTQAKFVSPFIVSIILCTYAVYEYYRDAFPSFISHVTIVIKHKLKEPFRKNYSVTFEEIQNKIKPLSQASGISLSC